MSCLSNMARRYFSRGVMPFWYVLLLDCMIVAVSGLIGMYMDYGRLPETAGFMNALGGLAVIEMFFVAAFWKFHTYRGWMRFISMPDLFGVLKAVAAGSLLTIVTSYVLDFAGCTLLILPHLLGTAVLFFMATLLMWIVRLAVRSVFEYVRQGKDSENTFIYGVGEGGVAIAKSLKSENLLKYTLAGFISPNGELESKYLMGIKVRRVGPNLLKHMKDENVKVVMVSPIMSDDFLKRQELIDSLVGAGIKILMMPKPEEWNGGNLTGNQFKEVKAEDLLPREPIDIDMTAIGNLLCGRRILITGAAGSIGSEMVRQVASFKPAEMVLVDQAETPMHDIRLMMAKNYADVKAETIVVSITNMSYMENIFAKYRPEYVFHAAAYKHVPMMEDNPAMAVQNNIRGTRIIADLAVKYGTVKFVMISTDKAVNPTNVMGCSKRICEIYCQSLNKAIQDGRVKGVTQFVTTRFGNVLGSNGSVIPIFRKQIQNGGPVTVTDPKIIRYFMLIPEACKLVLEAGTLGHGGEIFVFDMGEPVKILDLANRMIAQSGKPGIEVKFTGLRPGEKLFEETFSKDEVAGDTVHPKIFVAKVREYDYDDARRNEDELMKLAESYNNIDIVKRMMEIVPEYKPNNEEYNMAK